MTHGHTPYHGHRDPAKPFSVVVRYGTRGDTRERAAEAIRLHTPHPYATKAEAEEARKRHNGLSPFMEVSTFGGYL
jgi:hypothetical protein